jgi:hypothetical protein
MIALGVKGIEPDAANVSIVTRLLVAFQYRITLSPAATAVSTKLTVPTA